MTTVLVVGSGDSVRRCTAVCHNAKQPECDCVCGGRYHGGGTTAARSRVVEDVKAGRFGEGVKLAAEELEGTLFEEGD